MRYAGTNRMECAGSKWIETKVELPAVLLRQIERDAARREMSLRQWFTQVANNHFVDQQTAARLAGARLSHVPKLPVVMESAR